MPCMVVHPLGRPEAPDNACFEALQIQYLSAGKFMIRKVAKPPNGQEMYSDG
jgi:hypothetical protein